jgi:hypothetical protein
MDTLIGSRMSRFQMQNRGAGSRPAGDTENENSQSTVIAAFFIKIRKQAGLLNDLGDLLGISTFPACCVIGCHDGIR